MSRQFNLRKSRNLAQNILRENKTEINKLQKEWLPMPQIKTFLKKVIQKY